MEMARNLFNAGLEPMIVTPTTQRCAAFADLDVESRDRVLLAWMANEWVIAFIHSIPGIMTYNEAHDLYLQHMKRAGSFESHSRGTRRAKEEAEESNGETCANTSTNAKLRDRIRTPKWYDFYRLTNHWTSLRLQALDYYDSCVLCGLKDQTLDTHHRHYNTLGRENMKHLSVLCREHHAKVHTMLGIHCPREIPKSVQDVFRRENMSFNTKGQK